jgi:hypothetical protein
MSSSWKTSVFGLFALSILVFMFVSEAAGQYTRQPQSNRTQPGMQQPGMQIGKSQQPRTGTPASKETYSIVEVGKEYQIVTAASLKDLKKRLKDEFNSAKKAYLEAKKDKNNKGVTLEKPEEKTVKVIPGKSGYKTQEKAQEELQKLQEEREKGGKKSVR